MSDGVDGVFLVLILIFSYLMNDWMTGDWRCARCEGLQRGHITWPAMFMSISQGHQRQGAAGQGSPV